VAFAGTVVFDECFDAAHGVVIGGDERVFDALGERNFFTLLPPIEAVEKLLDAQTRAVVTKVAAIVLHDLLAVAHRGIVLLGRNQRKPSPSVSVVELAKLLQ
jgi:hypothetical protein